MEFKSLHEEIAFQRERAERAEKRAERAEAELERALKSRDSWKEKYQEATRRAKTPEKSSETHPK